MKKFNEMKIYFASPWFNPEQAEREERVKGKLRELGFNVWSPKDSAVCSPNATTDIRKKIFDDNVANINDCDILFAITDGKDMGTIWEAGYANGLNAAFQHLSIPKIIIIYYCESLGPNGQFNLMLAQSGDIVIRDFAELDKLPTMIENGEGLAYAGIVE